MARSSLPQVNISLTVLFAGLASFLLLYAFRRGRPDPASTKLLKDLELTEDDDDKEEDDVSDGKGSSKKKGKDVTLTPRGTNHSVSSETQRTPLVSNVRPSEGDSVAPSSVVSETSEEIRKQDAIASLHTQIEQIDKRGKTLFKKKKFLEAAEVFSEALNLIESGSGVLEQSASLKRQTITLMNNRSAMYEKAALPDLALHDCDSLLELDLSHTKARTRKLRILESLSRYKEALVEVCALQLRFMQENRDKIRMGLAVTPPVPQSKIEDLVGQILPNEIESYMQTLKEKYGTPDGGLMKPLPSNHTIVQLLQSFTGYNSWMAAAAKDGSLDQLSLQLDALSEDQKVERMTLLLKRGRRFAYHRKFESCRDDIEAAYDILDGEDGKDAANLLEGDTHARILEWAGMCRHLRYDLDGAAKMYEVCSDLEPTNAELLVKRAGVKMDASDLVEAKSLFETALGLDPTAVDALLHRANMYVLQAKADEAKADLERCIELRPDYILARLRLATVLMTNQDLDGAKKCLDGAEKIDPHSSDVHSYRGELHFAMGEFKEARAEFDRAIECDASNPTPYVNAALAVMNTPTPSMNGAIPESIRLLEKAIEVDPQFQTAYVHLGQLKLSMATDLSAAREVVALYDKGLDLCRSAEELKDIVSMRLLTIAQVDAASSLKMDTLNMQ